MDSPCGGYCCEKFYFRYNQSPEDLKNGPKAKEDLQVIEMVIYLGLSDTNVEGDPLQPPRHTYTCKHFDKETRLCKIYETRPSMCRTYNTSAVSSCGLKSCKAPKPPEIIESAEKLKVIEKEKVDADADRAAL